MNRPSQEAPPDDAVATLNGNNGLRYVSLMGPVREPPVGDWVRSACILLEPGKVGRSTPDSSLIRNTSLSITAGQVVWHSMQPDVSYVFVGAAAIKDDATSPGFVFLIPNTTGSDAEMLPTIAMMKGRNELDVNNNGVCVHERDGEECKVAAVIVDAILDNGALTEQLGKWTTGNSAKHNVLTKRAKAQKAAAGEAVAAVPAPQEALVQYVVAESVAVVPVAGELLQVQAQLQQMQLQELTNAKKRQQLQEQWEQEVLQQQQQWQQWQQQQQQQWQWQLQQQQHQHQHQQQQLQMDVQELELQLEQQQEELQDLQWVQEMLQGPPTQQLEEGALALALREQGHFKAPGEGTHPPTHTRTHAHMHARTTHTLMHDCMLT